MKTLIYLFWLLSTIMFGNDVNTGKIDIEPSLYDAIVIDDDLFAPTVESYVLFGEDIALMGYDLDKTNIHAGEMFTLRTFWQAEPTSITHYSMFIHLLSIGDTKVIAQYDGALISSKPIPNTGEQLWVGHSIMIQLPYDIVAGQYEIAIGLYNSMTNERLPLLDGTDTYRISVVVS